MTATLPPFIAVHGRKYSGKSTVASVLIEEYGYERVKMADPLKNMVRSLLRDAGYDDDFIECCVEGTKEEKERPLDVFFGKSTRRVFETLGTEWRDMIDPRLWVNIAALRIKMMIADGRRVVCDDLRFPFEVEALREHGIDGFFWKVIRPSLPPLSADVHPSEQPLPDHLFDALMFNNVEGDYGRNRLLMLVPQALKRRGLLLAADQAALPSEYLERAA